jgi:hypothetical protein
MSRMHCRSLRKQAACVLLTGKLPAGPAASLESADCMNYRSGTSARPRPEWLVPAQDPPAARGGRGDRDRRACRIRPGGPAAGPRAVRSLTEPVPACSCNSQVSRAAGITICPDRRAGIGPVGGRPPSAGLRLRARATREFRRPGIPPRYADPAARLGRNFAERPAVLRPGNCVWEPAETLKLMAYLLLGVRM